MEYISGSSVKVLQSDPDLIQISSLNTGKGKGLGIVADMLGVPYECILAIGDAENDIDMLQLAGYPIAIANAPRSCASARTLDCPI